MSSDYDDALRMAITELGVAMRDREKLDFERENLDRKIAKLREGVLGLGILCGRPKDEIMQTYPGLFPNLIDPDIGLTDAVRKVLWANYPRFLSPVRVAEKLDASGYDKSNQMNLLASLHTILKRLKAQGQVLTGSRDGKTVYKWKGGDLEAKKRLGLGSLKVN